MWNAQPVSVLGVGGRRVGLEGCESTAWCLAFYPTGSAALFVCHELVSGTWAITREVTAPPRQLPASVFPISADILSRLS